MAAAFERLKEELRLEASKLFRGDVSLAESQAVPVRQPRADGNEAVFEAPYKHVEAFMLRATQAERKLEEAEERIEAAEEETKLWKKRTMESILARWEMNDNDMEMLKEIEKNNGPQFMKTLAPFAKNIYRDVLETLSKEAKNSKYHSSRINLEGLNGWLDE